MVPDLAFRHLRYFLAVAETENFTRAAERLGVTQPAVSQQVRDLEVALKAQLLRRSGRRVQLTEAGRGFAQQAAWLLRRFESALAHVDRAEGAVAGHLDVGTVPALHLPWMPPVLAAMAERFPDVTVTVHERASAGVETEVEAGRFDLGFGIGSHPSPALSFERLAAQKLALVLPSGHALAKRARVTPAELAEHALVLLPTSFDMRRLTDDALQQSRAHVRVAYELSTIDTVLAAVRATGLATILPPIVMRGRDDDALRAVPLALRAAPIPFGVFLLRAAPPSPLAREFLRLLRQTLRAR